MDLLFFVAILFLGFYLRSALKRINLLEAAIKKLQSVLTSTVSTPEPNKTPPVSIAASVNRPEPDEMPIADKVRENPETLQPFEFPAKPSPLISPATASAAANAASTTSHGRREAPDQGSLIWPYIQKYLLGGNTAVRVGVLLLLLGIGFLLKYSIDHSKFPIELRLTGAVIAAIAMLVVGWLLRTRRSGYALTLQGGGVGILYLTIFTALRLYQLIPPNACFALLVIISLFSAALAILQNSRSLAILGTLGGFMAPLLVTMGVGNHVVLFSYYALLNIMVLSIACFKSWRVLNLIGFVFTFSVMAVWVHHSYEAVLFTTTEPFLILFFVMYVAITVLFSRRQAADLKNYADSCPIFGVPIVVFSLQIYFANHYHYGLALSALTAAIFYIALAWLLSQKHAQNLRLLIETFLAIGILFATVAIPMALDGRWTAAVWSLQGAGMVWVGARQQRMLTRAFGVLVLLGASVAFSQDVGWATASPAVLNAFYLGRIFISLAALFAAYWLQRDHLSVGNWWQRPTSIGLLILGLLWWFGAGSYEISQHGEHGYISSNILVFVSLSLAVIFYLSRRLAWKALEFVTNGQLLVMYTALLPGVVLTYVFGNSWSQFFHDQHPFSHGGYLAWPIAFIVHYGLLYCRDTQKDVTPKLRHYSHAAAVWLFAVIVGWECAWGMQQLASNHGVWSLIGWVLAPLMIVVGIICAATHTTTTHFWPIRQYQACYLATALFPLLFFISAWSIVTNFTSSGDPWPLPYVLIINPLDLAQGFIIITLGYWFTQARKIGLNAINADSTLIIYSTLSGVTFIWLTAVLIRTLHHWAGIPFVWNSIFASVLVQSAISIFWTLLACGSMMIATRYKQRSLWLVGAGLLAVVVIKLFIIDLDNSGTLARVISFIGVGVLLLLIGYLSPVPPKASVIKNPETHS